MKQLEVASTLTVWLENWEWQCCGEPFSVGSEVDWDMFPTRAAMDTYLCQGLGREVFKTITHSETHHHDQAREPRPVRTRGRITSIDAVYWALAPRTVEDPRSFYPVPGTAVLEPRERADGWEPEVKDLSFARYVVGLEVIES